MSSSNSTDVAIDVHLEPGSFRLQLEADVTKGLSSTPKDLPPKWFYDERGSDLFDQITRLAEYYPTETERSILTDSAAEIVRSTKARTLVELGSGSSDKTTAILDAMAAAGQLDRYVPFDVSPAPLRAAADRLVATYPGLDVHGVVGDFDHHLGKIPAGPDRLIAFLGGTMGNYQSAARADLLSDLAALCGPTDHLLIGMDLVKDTDRLVAAYDDASGVTAQFNLNVLSVLNNELGANFDLDAFEHVAVWSADDEWIEMRLRSTRDQTISFTELDMTVDFAAGEEMRTEVSAKFRRKGFATELEAAGLVLVDWFTDPAGDFALALAHSG